MNAALDYVLVVDDDEAVRVVLRETLRNDGHEVLCASDGAEALHIMAREKAPQLVILDLMMPHVSGWQVLQVMEGSPRLASVPVVILTAFDTRPELPLGRSILHKPIEAPLLLDLTRALVDQEQSLRFALCEPPSDLMPRRLTRRPPTHSVVNR